MRLIKSFQRSMFLLFTLVVIALSYGFYLAISHIVVEQSRIHHQSVAPVFSLINDELMYPLHVSQTLAHSRTLKKLMNAKEIDQGAMTDFLGGLEKNLGLSFFAASENTLRQYNSDGSSFALTPGKVEWYFNLRTAQENFFAELGQKEDVHLYLDLKVFNDNGEFLGFVGIGKSLRQFWQKFTEHKLVFGYDLMFVNNKNQILLSSDENLHASATRLVHMQELSWYPQVEDRAVRGESLNSSVIHIEKEEFLLSEIYIDLLDWKLYLLSPLKSRKADITRSFVINVAIIFALIVLLFICGHFLIRYFAHHFQHTLHRDALTGLANRTLIEQSYAKIIDAGDALSVIMIDIDHFKNINDSFGHNAGDQVIKQVSDLLKHSVRELDIVGRWGGEEFILLLPGANLSLAQAVAERVRVLLAAQKIDHGDQQISVTASFGVTYSELDIELKKVVAVADKALYQAKAQGRNKVCSLLNFN
ncbi:sensor domain-containing diguanylate cyclase [Thalassomonas actiniarum]|uniref:diguanylate cyclase n=1 Tax=Thalassomonas actiniarum TaxID=485447 RepID=A0AAE9YU04_9GAMM|nr:sensor domain-containing diguanylate cyclase [Thalassomonas actiniarum]WDE00394.1 GGDEF domain-containing protein [Thalassomonas actiniarum]